MLRDFGRWISGPSESNKKESNSGINEYSSDHDDVDPFAEEHEAKTFGWVEHNQLPDPEASKPVKKCNLVISCPVDGCNVDKISWKCSECSELIKYGLTDDHYYCDCGKLSIDSCKYICNEHDAEPADAELLKPSHDLNVLIMGETGVGKSTFINAFTNYLTYATLSDAIHGDLITLIANSFSLTDDNMISYRITNGKETEDENLKVGQSATQSTKVHRFAFRDYVIRIIDTPGIGDVRGTVQDDKNFQDILNTISSLDNLHGIIILLKPNAARLTVTFRYCIEELLSHLHKSAKDNVIFGFTNTRSTNFRPGDTWPALLEHLTNTKVDIQCTKENVYCFDSEGYRFLAALKHGIKFDNDLFESYRSSWDHSVKETARLITYIRNLEPHKTKETLSLNAVRNLILNLTKPMAEITRNIVLNVEVLKKEESRIERLSADTKNLKKDLMVDKIDLHAKELGHPRTVCTNSKCVKMTEMGGHHKINYTTWCHNHCYLDGVQIETTNNPALLQCWAMNGTHTCRECSHNYGEHMHITYELIESTLKVENESVKKLVDENATLKQVKETAIAGLRVQIDELKREHVTIEKTAAKFGAFLEQNAITAYSDARLEYLQFLINEEKKKAPKFKDEKLLAALEDSLRIYTEEVKSIKRAIKDGRCSDSLDISNIGDSIDELYRLKHSGKTLKQMKNVAIKASSSNYREANHDFSHLSGGNGLHSAAASSQNAPKNGIRGTKNRAEKNVSPAQKSRPKQQVAQENNPSKSMDNHTKRKDSKRAEQTPREDKLLQAEGEKVAEYIGRCVMSFKQGLTEQELVDIIIEGLQPQLRQFAYDEDFTKVFALKKYLIKMETNLLNR